MSGIIKLLSAAAGILAGTHLAATEAPVPQASGDETRLEASCAASVVASTAPRCLSLGLRIARG